MHNIYCMSLHFKRLGVLLLSLFWLVSFFNITNADVITYSNWGWGSIASNWNLTINPNSCVLFTNSSCASRAKFLDTNNNEITATKTTYALICNTYNTDITYENWHTTSCSTYYYSWLLTNIQDLKTCPTCPSQYTSQECQLEYNLIPVSSVDSNYCTTNWLCPSSWSGDCWSWSTNWSALFINDIQHLWKPVISIDIPEEINWDYTSTDSEFNLEVIGYNVDYDYINGIVNTQNYTPTREDLTAVISSMGPFVSLLVWALFIILVFYFIKKIFK